MVRSGRVRSIRSGQVDQENSSQGFRSGHVVQSGEIRSVCEFRLGQVSSGKVGQLMSGQVRSEKLGQFGSGHVS